MARLRGLMITEAYLEESGSVVPETEGEDFIRILDGACFKIIPADE